MATYTHIIEPLELQELPYKQRTVAEALNRLDKNTLKKPLEGKDLVPDVAHMWHMIPDVFLCPEKLGP